MVRNSLRAGAAEGLVAWLSYGIAELIHLTVFPWFTTPSHLISVPHPGFTALVMAIYAVSGLASGITISALWPTLRGLTLRAAAVTTILTAYIAVQWRYLPDRRIEQSGLYVALIGLAAVWIATRTDRLGRLLRPIIEPWAMSFLVLMTPWVLMRFIPPSIHEVGRNDRDWGIAMFSVATCFCVIYGLALLIQRFIGTQSPGRRVIIGTGVALGVWVVGSTIQQTSFTTAHRASKAPKIGTPNVIVITLDTLRADHMSVYGYKRDTTPNLESFALEAVRYVNSFSTGDYTFSSHASLFTGLYPIRHGAHPAEKDSHHRPLDEAHTTLAELLAANGYTTAAVVANPGWLSQTFGLAQGFAHYDQRSTVPLLSSIEARFTIASALRNVLIQCVAPGNAQRRAAFDKIARPAEAINAAVYEQIESFQKESTPFFLFINYMDSHWPYIPPPPFDRRYPGLDKSFTSGLFYGLRHQVLHQRRQLTEAQFQHLVSQYDGGIAYLDRDLGRLFDRLRKHRLWDNTLIVVTADHGEAFGERELMEHGVSVYQDQIHVPWLMKYPDDWGQKDFWKGSTRKEPISSVDLLPTVLDVVGIEIPGNIDGVSLARTVKERTIYSESYPQRDLTKSARFRRVERAVMTDRWKLVSSTAGKCELYDLDADPSETQNLCHKEASLTRALMEDVNSWLRRAGPKDKVSKTTDPQTLERLHSLGYIQ